MAKKNLWLGMLVIVLVFGTLVVGCDGAKDDITVTFDANGGGWNDGNTTKSVKVAFDSSWNNINGMVTNPNRQGYSFKRWTPVPNPAPNTFYDMGSFLSDRTVYADWE